MGYSGRRGRRRGMAATERKAQMWMVVCRVHWLDVRTAGWKPAIRQTGSLRYMVDGVDYKRGATT